MEDAEGTRRCRSTQGNRRMWQHDWSWNAEWWRASGCSGEARQPARRVGKVPMRSVRGNDTDNTCDGCMIDEQINSWYLFRPFVGRFPLGRPIWFLGFSQHHLFLGSRL